MDEKDLSALLEKYANGNATPEEINTLTEWYRTRAMEDAEFPDEEEIVSARMLQRLHDEIKPTQNSRRRYWWMSGAAAVLLISIGTFLITRTDHHSGLVVLHPSPIQVLPGSNKAILTLSGGKQVVLNDANNGQLAKQGLSKVEKTSSGNLLYSNESKMDEQSGLPTENMAYNTLTTPNGGQYAVTLSDGTRVWLNAASSITYPTAFTGKERHVKLIGEAYFEVAKNPDKPFKVDVAGKQDITVLGTHFDIEAYSDDDRIKTTLLEGSIRLNYLNQQLIVKPDQTVVNNFNGKLQVQSADVDEVMAWKNGMFVFNDENIKDVMRKAARWYDVDVSYQGDISNKRLGGVISRYKSIVDLLDNISKTGNIHYKIIGRRVILMR